MVDIVLRDDSKPWLIVGFFTPNYQPLAAKFAESLKRQGLPHHLFAVEPSGDWSSETMRKPAIVLNAMKAYPDKTLILMDVDCIVNGPLDELSNIVGNADFSCFPTLRVKKFRGHSQRFSLSSRVMFVRPTDGARKLMEQWQAACRERPNLHGAERNLVLAFTRAVGVNFSPMPEDLCGSRGTKALRQELSSRIRALLSPTARNALSRTSWRNCWHLAKSNATRGPADFFPPLAFGVGKSIADRT